MLNKLLKNLTSQGILSLNRRNLDFVLKYNQRKFYPLVDDKIMTKRLAIQAGIAVPDLYYVVEREQQREQLLRTLMLYSDFVIKPAQGSGGDGVLVITGRHQNRFRKSNGEMIAFDDVAYHVSNILGGIYSLGGHRDKAMIEYRIQLLPLFDKIAYQGVPDIRIIVLQGYPVMAMLRLPTRQSLGKANLHQGAIGVGIELATGETMEGVLENKKIFEHPDTNMKIKGIEIPNWHDCLTLAARCSDITNLGYLGVDIVLDETKGPLILEINARPGLSIQIANESGLLPRLQAIESCMGQDRSLQEKVIWSQKNL